MYPHMSLEVGQLLEEVQSLKGLVYNLEVENRLLRLQVKALEMAQAKPVKAEDERQLPLQIEATETLKIEEVAEDDQSGEAQEAVALQLPSSTTRRGNKQRIRGAEKFANIPVEKEIEYIPAEVQQHPERYERIGEVVTHEVHVTPAKLFRVRIKRPKFRIKMDREACPIIAKAPARFCNDYASISLAVHIAIGKYLEHGSLNRLEKQFARMGADISRQTQSDLIERIRSWVQPLYDKIDQHLRRCHYLQLDETFINYINGRQPGGGQGYFWAKNAPGLGVVYQWIANRKHENVSTIVAGFSGILQSDGYAAYANYAKVRSDVILAACWSHTFRKFRDALKDEPLHARAAMKLIGKLYELEEEWDRDGVDPPRRKQLRTEQSMPIAEELKALLDQWAADMSIPKNKFREAVGYAAGQWPGLLECLRHGHTKLDTNLLESKFRPTKIGERNWMFIGHPEAGDKSAVMYTILACCRIHSIEPRAYLTDILEKLVPAEHHPKPELLESLLPWNWAAAHPEALVKEPPRL